MLRPCQALSLARLRRRPEVEVEEMRRVDWLERWRVRLRRGRVRLVIVVSFPSTRDDW